MKMSFISSANLSKNLPFEDNSHDVIVLSHGLEYYRKPISPNA
jgi:ubiquinone/menaquinone biosynthesis C-methylase UbiE